MLVKNAAAEIGIDLRLQTQDGGTYYGDANFGPRRARQDDER